MNKHDVVALLTLAERRCHNKRFDILPVVFYLFSSGAISRVLYQALTKLFTKGETCLKIIMRLARECTFVQLVHALFMCNQSILAEQLLEERYHRGTICLYIFSLARDGSFHSAAASFYRILKSNIDNCVFRDKNDFLWRMVQRLKIEIRRHPPDSTKQRHAADKLMVVHCLRLETFENTAERFSIIQDMHDGMLLSPVTTEGDALFQCKLGSTYALEGDFHKSNDYIRGARSVLCETRPSFPVHYIYLNEVFTELVGYQNTPTEEIKTRLLFLGNRGLQSTIEDEDETHTRHIKLMLLTFMISCLLGVGIDFEDINVRVTDSDRKYARSLLAQFDWLSDDLESRREMAYCYLMSRLLQHEDRDRAMCYGFRAKVLSDSGVFREAEKRNISKFIDRFKV